MKALKELAQVAKEIPDAVNACKSTYDSLADLVKAIEVLSSPKEFVFHVAKDILVNGVQIYHDVEVMITDYHAQKW